MPELTTEELELRRAYSRWYKRYGPNSTRAWFAEYKRTLRCEECGEKHPAALDFHHIDPSTKDRTVKAAVRDERSRDVILAEIAKCRVLCANCHRKHHWIESELQRARDDEKWRRLFAEAELATPETRRKTNSVRGREHMTKLWQDPAFRERHRQRIIAYNAKRKAEKENSLFQTS